MARNFASLFHVTVVLLVVHTSCAQRQEGSSAEVRHALSPPPGYKHTAFRLIVPQHALATLHWHDALRHAAFLSLRRRINSHDGNAQRAEMALWQRLTAAPVSPPDLAKPVYEDADITTLASGVLVREAGHLAFLPEASLLEQGSAPRKVSALWSVLRVRHSGPGLSAPRVEYYFTVQPASHLTLVDHSEKQHHKVIFKKLIPKPTLLFKPVPVQNKVPVFSSSPGQYYNPHFLNLYRNSVQNFVIRPENEQSGPTLLEVNQGLRNPSEPIYILPTPRYVQPPTFPRLSGLVQQQGGRPKLVNVLIPRQPIKVQQLNYQQQNYQRQQYHQQNYEQQNYQEEENDVTDYDTQESQRHTVLVLDHNFSMFETAKPTLSQFHNNSKMESKTSTEVSENDFELLQTSTVATTKDKDAGISTNQKTLTATTTILSAGKEHQRGSENTPSKRGTQPTITSQQKEQRSEILHSS